MVIKTHFKNPAILFALIKTIPVIVAGFFFDDLQKSLEKSFQRKINITNLASICSWPGIKFIFME